MIECLRNLKLSANAYRGNSANVTDFEKEGLKFARNGSQVVENNQSIAEPKKNRNISALCTCRASPVSASGICSSADFLSNQLDQRVLNLLRNYHYISFHYPSSSTSNTFMVILSSQEDSNIKEEAFFSIASIKRKLSKIIFVFVYTNPFSYVQSIQFRFHPC